MEQEQEGKGGERERREGEEKGEEEGEGGEGKGRRKRRRGEGKEVVYLERELSIPLVTHLPSYQSCLKRITMSRDLESAIQATII